MSFKSKSILLLGALFVTDKSYLISLSTLKSSSGSLFDYLLSSDLLDCLSLSEINSLIGENISLDEAWKNLVLG